MSRALNNNRSFSGDTIIEVLLAMTVAVTVIAGAYVLANRAMRIGREAQERTEANKLAQGQVEALESLARAGLLDAESQIPDNASGTYCLPTWDATLWAGKKAVPTGTSNVCTRQNRYTLSVYREDKSYFDNAIVKGGQYRITVDWEGLGDGSPSRSVEIHYRAYEDVVNTTPTPIDPPSPPTNCDIGTFSIGQDPLYLSSSLARRQRGQAISTMTACRYWLRLQANDQTHATFLSPTCDNTPASCNLAWEWQPYERLFLEGYTNDPASGGVRTFQSNLTEDIPDRRSDVCSVLIQPIDMTADTRYLVLKHVSLWDNDIALRTAARNDPNQSSVHGAYIRIAPTDQGFSTACTSGP